MPSVPTPDPELLPLVRRRAELLAESRERPDRSTAELDHVTGQLLGSLEGGEPVVRRLTHDEPGDLLGRLVAKEPVHPFDERGSSAAAQLIDRLDADRRCYVLEHPLLPGHPLNVVWVALWQGIATDVGAILDADAPRLDPEHADTAVFYSIWNVEPGLVGVPGGKSLITGAMAELRREFSQLADFVTLSPIPGFREWWDNEHPAHGSHRQAVAQPPADGLRDPMERACARYLTTFGDDGRLLDAVARFHMGNGARLLQLDWRADLSERGLRRSYGLMANYHYEPEDRAANQILLDSGVPAIGPAVGGLLAEQL